MLNKDRKNIADAISNVKSILDKHAHLKEYLLYLDGIENYQQMQEFYAQIIVKLTKELNKLPIEHRYTGTFYIRKAYTTPVEYEQIVGSAFMREDLISWAIENDDRFKGVYHREIFKEPNYKFPIAKTDGESVFFKAKA